MVSHYGPFTSHQVNVDAGGNDILGDTANEPSLCVDPTNADRMVIGWRQFDSIFSNFRQAGYGYTTDRGMTWRFPGVLENNVFRSDPVLNSDNAGNFFYLSLLQNFFDDLWRSLNGGQSWARFGLATGGDKQWFTIDRTNGMGHGFQYQFWSTDGNNYAGRQFSRSTDGGRSFSAARRINDDPINHSKWHWFGTFSVAPNGRLDAVWLDTRNAANNTDSQLFYSSSMDGGNTWSPNIALTNSFNPFIGYPNQRKIGDYITIVSDNTGGNVAYAATFNGEEDVYYLRVPENPGWSVVGVADFNRDGHPDYLLYNGSMRQTAIWYLNNNVLSSGLYGPALPAGC